MSKLKIFKASAGSGKTYTLAKEFLELLFMEPYNYKYILAVTFTNKATAEMKNRILNYLFDLTTVEKPEFLDYLKEITGRDKESVRRQAKRILTYILNDFSHFNITTIDSFFQKIIRSFAFEAGLPTNLRIELDSENILKESIDTILKELDIEGKKEVKKWIFSHALNKLQEKGDWKISDELYLLGKEIFKEDFQKLSPTMIKKINDKVFLDSYRNSLRDIITSFESTIKELSGLCIEHLNRHDVSWGELKGMSRSPLKILEKLSSGRDLPKDVTGITKLYETTSADDIQNSKNSAAKNQKVESCFNGGFYDTLVNLIETYRTKKEHYFTAKAILPNISSFGILTNISDTVKTMTQEQNLFLLSEANKLLNSIIDDNEAPFIYEKTGTRYRHYMIDEFQDTSELQWLNFKPLIDNSLSESNKALVVGDVKQSIYRWRSSDWELLSHKIQQDFITHGVDKKTLSTNWRSFENIIHFNNTIFSKGAKLLQSEFIQSVKKDNQEIELSGKLEQLITEAYNDVSQKVSTNGLNKGGYVDMQFITAAKNEEYEEQMLPLLCEKIEQLTDAGYRYRDICILVRTKSEGRMISEYLLGNSQKMYPVVSDETLVLDSSPAVDAVISKLKFILSPDNEVLKAQIKLSNLLLQDDEHFSSKSASADILAKLDSPELTQQLNSLSELKGKPLFELTESIIRQLPQWLQKEQSPYLRELLNRVQDFMNNRSVNLANFLEWWDDKGSNSSISIPDGQNAIKIMTIHKSKGLEFKAVIVPFCHWVLDKKSHDSLIWCKPQTAPFNQLDIVPVNYTSKLIHSELFPQYITERLLQFIDNLNVLYVAFTRASEALITIGMLKRTSQDNLRTVSDLLIKTINSNTETPKEDTFNINDYWDEENFRLSYGEIPVQTHEVRESAPHPPKLFKTTPLGKRIKIHTDSNSMQPELLNDYRIHGKIMHLLFERIKTKEDIESSIDSLISEGKLLSESKQELQNKIENLLSSAPYNEWFSSKYKILNEVSILQKNGTSRPDRVLINNNKVIVIDYKFGQLRSNKYGKQVRHYMSLIKKMEYKNIEGYIWYINQDSTLEKVSM